MKWIFARRLRPFVLLAAAVSFALNITMLAPAIYMMQVFDRVFTSGSIETLGMLAGLALLFLVLGYFLDTVRARALAWAGRSLDCKLAPEAIHDSIEQAARGPGRIDTDAIKDIAQLRAFLSGSGVLALFDAPWLPIYLLFITLMHPMLGLTAAFGALALAALGVLTDRMTREQAEESVRRSRESVRLAEKLARNAEVVFGMGMTRTVVGRFSDHHDELLAAQQRHTHISTALSAFGRALRQILQVVMLAVGAWLVIEMKATAGVMIAATILLARALQPVEHLISGWRGLLNARGAWQRLEEREAGHSTAFKLDLPSPTGRVELERISYSFAPTRPPLIKNISLSLTAGESLGVIGASASGKTTLLRLILGVWRPTAGVVRLDGADISRWDRDALGEHVGYLPQDVELFAGSVAENIARLEQPLDAAASETIVSAARLAHAHEMILQLPDGYDTQIGEGGAVLSGGQRQRIALARALFGEPRLVVLDEPNANLDAQGEAALLAALAELKARGVTVIMVTHNLQLMTALDKLSVLRSGGLEMFGASTAVLARLRAASTTRVVSFPGTAKNTEVLA